jgi:hypothetical protein
MIAAHAKNMNAVLVTNNMLPLVEKSKSRFVRQLATWVDNKVGCLNDLLKLLNAHKIHVLALSTVDLSECSLVRLVIDNLDEAHSILLKNGYRIKITEVVGIEISTEQELKKITSILVEAEINLHYMYSMIMRPNGNAGLIVAVEDTELAYDTLKRYQLKTLLEEDLVR